MMAKETLCCGLALLPPRFGSYGSKQWRPTLVRGNCAKVFFEKAEYFFGVPDYRGISGVRKAANVSEVVSILLCRVLSLCTRHHRRPRERRAVLQ